MKIALGVGLILVATALVAQDAQMTEKQQAAKCKAEGGCTLFTRDAFISIIRAASEAAYRQGAQTCSKSM